MLPAPYRGDFLMNNKTSSSESVAASIIANQKEDGMTKGEGVFKMEVIRNGEVIDSEEFPNLIVNQGLNYKRDVALLDGTKIATWYLALVSGTPTIVAGDTYASHGGWTEVTNYTEANRPTWQGATDGTGVATNSSNRAEYTIGGGGATIGGAALVGGGSAGSTKGDTAGGGTLFSASAFSGGNRALVENDILRITWQHTDSNA
jgi:hypothetical protein